MTPKVDLQSFVARASDSPLGSWADLEPWRLTSAAPVIVEELLAAAGDGFQTSDGVAVHASARIEAGAVIKGPAVIGPGCFVAAGAYLRDGVWLEADCTLGPGCELKSCFAFRGTALAHFNFAGDSILGEDVNLEAGSVVANHRNERAEKSITVHLAGSAIETAVEKFGALIGDGCRIGANAVLAPGTLMRPGSIVPRLRLVDQEDGRGARDG